MKGQRVCLIRSLLLRPPLLPLTTASHQPEIALKMAEASALVLDVTQLSTATNEWVTLTTRCLEAGLTTRCLQCSPGTEAKCGFLPGCLTPKRLSRHFQTSVYPVHSHEGAKLQRQRAYMLKHCASFASAGCHQDTRESSPRLSRQACYPDTYCFSASTEAREASESTDQPLPGSLVCAHRVSNAFRLHAGSL